MDNKNITGLDDMLAKLEAVKDYINNDVKDVIGVEGVKHFKNNFQEEGFDGTKWDARQTTRKGSTNGQKILTKSAELGDANDYRVEGDDVIFTNDKPYAEIHNEGFDGEETVKAHTRTINGVQQQVKEHLRHMKMKKRQFIGDSPLLAEKITNKITRDLDKLTQ